MYYSEVEDELLKQNIEQHVRCRQLKENRLKAISVLSVFLALLRFPHRANNAYSIHRSFNGDDTSYETTELWCMT